MSLSLREPDKWIEPSQTESVLRPLVHSPLRIGVEAAFRQKRLFLTILIVVLALTAAVTILKHRQFQSNMKFMVQASRSNAVISADRGTGTSAPSDITEQQINSEMQLLQSEDVISAVVDPTWNNVKAAAHTKAEIEEHDGKIAAFTKHLTVEAIRKANVISVSFLASTPEDAASYLDKLSVAYMAARKQITRPAGTSEFFAEETGRYRDAWAKAKEQMVEFQKANGLVSVPDTEAGISQQIMTAENDLRTAQIALGEAQHRIKESSRLSSEVPARQPTTQTLTPNLGAIQQIQSALVQLQNKRTELLTRYQPTDRLVLEVDKQINDTEATLEKVEQRKNLQDATDVNPAWQQARTSQVVSSLDQKAAESRIASLKNDLANLHAQLSHVQNLGLEFNNLQEQVDQSRNNFEIFSEKRDQSAIEDAMDERKLVNIAVAQSPTVNYQQVAPRPVLYAALGLITALFIGCSAVYLAETGRSTIATPRELDTLTRFPVLATLAKVPGGISAERLEILPVRTASKERSNGIGSLIPVVQNMQETSEL